VTLDMLRKIAQRLKRLTVEPVGFDPSGLDDPLALRIEWSPARGGGASFRTHKLVQVDPMRLEFRASGGALVFYAVFLLMGIGVLVGFSIASSSGALTADGSWTPAFLLPMAVGLVFTVAGGSMLYFGAAPIVFDKRRGEFWKGRTAPYEVTRRDDLKHYAALEQIHALQLVSEYCRSSDSSYYSYELNLVLEDGSRINVVDHGNREELRKDAESLSVFLEKPVWDGT
jgi:hypothetical protein